MKYRVEALLSPPGARDEGLAIGVNSDDERVAAWGDRSGLDERPTRMLSIPHRDCLGCALTIPSAALAAVSTTAKGRAEVETNGVLGDLARHFLEPSATSSDGSGADLIVVSGNEPATWQASMARLRPEGTLVALMGPHAEASEFDFYPQVHSRSLKVVLLAWFLPPLNPQGTFSQWHDAAVHVSRNLLSPSRNASGWTWLIESDLAQGPNVNKTPTGD